MPELAEVREAVTGVLVSGEERHLATSKAWWSFLQVDNKADCQMSLSLAPLLTAPGTKLLLGGCGLVLSTTALATAFVGRLSKILATDASTALTGVMMASLGALWGIKVLSATVARETALPRLTLLAPDDIDRLM